MHLPLSVLATLIVSLIPAASAIATDWIVDPARAREAGLQAYWQTTLPMLPGEAVTGVSIQDRQVYVTTNLGVLHAIAADTGLVRWTASLAEHGSQIYTPQNIGSDPQDGFVLVTTVADVYILGQLDGESLVRIGLRLPPSGPATTNGARIYVGGNNGWLHAIPLNDGFLEWRAAGTLDERLVGWASYRRGVNQNIPGRAPMTLWGGDWAIRTEHIIPSPLSLLGDRLYYSSGRQVVCVNAADKTPLWTRAVRGDIAGAIVASDYGVLVATRDNNLVCLDSTTGRLSWRSRLDGPCADSAVLVGDTIYQSTENAGLYAIDAATGSTRWRVPDGRELLSVDGARAFVRVGSSVSAVDHSTGRVGERVLLPIDSHVATNVTGPGVIAATSDGVVLSMVPKDLPYLRATAVRREVRRPPAEDAALDAELQDITTPPSESLEERHPLDSSEGAAPADDDASADDAGGDDDDADDEADAEEP